MPAGEPDWTAPIEELLVARQGGLGRLRLNRPGPINALTLAMIEAITHQLREFAEDESITAVALDGAGERGLCSGADVREIREWMVHGSGDPVRFWRAEYALNAMIADYPKPYVAFMDGIVMGGGIGLSAHGSLRLVTERTRAAMPETGIGFFPDVGALYFLSRSPGQVGTHLALTGTSMTGADAIAAGLADSLIPAEQWPQLCARLAAGEEVDAAVGERAPTSGLLGQRHWIDPCYRGEDPAEIEAALCAYPAAEPRSAAETLRSRSPLSVAVALAALRRAESMDSVAEVLEQDLRLGMTFLPGSDFVEGVRALLVDKDNAPQWQYDSVAQVPPERVEALFT
ncbi:MAG TPA: enoyl-CoA hydratase/isomerase family protein [Candidatus Ruania gallistercoris]|uniref:3-hydroxyisobutyryl-CoA hydrolase n=1 Tax=Candidatus Ruania gallistercoris TaxID=2838746 RepID=A0A9D2EBX0_9MICO|nr:enoyl-CoA hydratase/isomerase family protein [Candidatus Ruania gallistercoris]